MRPSSLHPGGAAPAFDQAALSTAFRSHEGVVPGTPPVRGPNVAEVTSSALRRAAHQYDISVWLIFHACYFWFCLLLYIPEITMDMSSEIPCVLSLNLGLQNLEVMCMRHFMGNYGTQFMCHIWWRSINTWSHVTTRRLYTIKIWHFWTITRGPDICCFA
jgi:hypothetical protein